MNMAEVNFAVTVAWFWSGLKINLDLAGRPSDETRLSLGPLFLPILSEQVSSISRMLSAEALAKPAPYLVVMRNMANTIILDKSPACTHLTYLG